ncbi:MAG: sulfurtransferase TusA family protein [Acidilobaceae archaeon]
MRIKAKLVVDARGMMCPYPIMLLSLNLKSISPGEVIEVRATDPAFERDVVSWANSTGHEILGVNKEGDEIVAYVKRVK